MSPGSPVLQSKLDKKLNISPGSQQKCTGFRTGLIISGPVKMSPRSPRLRSKLNYMLKDHFTGNGNFSF